MREKRNHVRFKVNLQLEISELFKQDNVKVENINAPLQVINMSQSGIGFRTESLLPLDYYFNAKVTLGDENEVIYCVIKIIRSILLEDGSYVYGGELVGLAPVFNYLFEEYEDLVD